MATKKKAVPKEKAAKKGPKQATLAGMEDRALEELEAVAEEYVDIRDRRMRLTEKESELNEELLVLMKKHKKAEYHHGEVHCWVKATEEKVKVKLGEITPKQKRKESEDVSTTAKIEQEETEQVPAEAPDDQNAEPETAVTQ